MAGFFNPMKKLLALNRGEIAIRIMRAATELGLRTVAIYSKEDRLASTASKPMKPTIGEGQGPVEAYLDIEGIVALAQEKASTPSTPATASYRRTPPSPAPAQQRASPSSGPARTCSN